MRVRHALLISLCVLCILGPVPSVASAQPTLTDAIAIVTDPVTLERESQAGMAPFQVHVVYLNPDPVFGSVAAVQFGIELEPGLSVIGTNSNGIVLEPAPLEYVIAFPDCQTESTAEAFVLLSLIVAPDASAAPGAGIRLTGLASLSEPIRATRCTTHELFFPIDFGGVIVNPIEPAIAAFSLSPPLAVEGRNYELAWDTVGGGNWLLDGGSVPARGTILLPTVSSRSHLLSLDGGGVERAVDVEVIREPRVLQFDTVETENPGQVRLTWNFAGALGAYLSGVGPVPPQGARLIDTTETEIIEVSATNEWGTGWASIELVPASGAPVIADFRTDPETYSFGDRLLLRYSVTGAAEIVIEPGFGRVPIGSGALEFMPIAGQVWRMTATNSVGSTTAEFTTHAAPPRILYFRVKPEEFGPNVPVELSYGVAGTDSVWIQAGELLPPEQGVVQVVTPVTSRLYTLTAMNQAGQDTRELVLTSLPPSLSFGGPEFFAEGQPIELSWQALRTETLIFYPDSIPLQTVFPLGSITVRPDSTTTYRLIASNATGTVGRQHTVAIGAPFIETFTLDPRPSMVGDVFDFVWHVYGADEIEIVDGSGPIPGVIQPGPSPPAEGRISHVFNEPYTGVVQLIARNEFGVRSKSIFSSVRIVPRTRLITYFRARDPVINSGESTSLWWQAEYFALNTIAPGPGKVSGVGYHEVTPGPGTHFWVLTSKYFSHVETDTAWVNVDARSFFGTSPKNVYYGEPVTLTYSAPFADRVLITPGVGEVDPNGVSIQVNIDRHTTFLFNAWYDGEREVIERYVGLYQPAISRFELSDTWIRPTEPVDMFWNVRGPEVVTLISPSGDSTVVAAVDTLTLDSPEFGTWVLSAANSTATTEQSVVLREWFDFASEFRSNPLLVPAGAPTTIQWDVPDATRVYIYGEGYQSASGSLEVIPNESRYYELRADGLPQGSYPYRLAPVRVDLDAEHPATVFVSVSPDGQVHDPAPVQFDYPDGLPRYVVFVVCENLLGSLQAINFTLDLPDWLEVEEVQPGRAEGYETTDPHVAVRFSSCWRGYPFSGRIARLVLKQVASPQPGKTSTIGILEGAVWHPCFDQFEEYGSSLPGLPLEIGEPMRMGNAAVAVLALPLETKWNDAGLTLSWPGLPDVEFTLLEVLRGSDERPPTSVAVVGDASSWTDFDATRLVAAGPIYYQLVGHVADGKTWQSANLRIDESPVNLRPVRTRLVGARPNPFNPSTTIHWELANPGTVSVAIYDLAGRRVRDWRFESQNWGQGQLVWDGKDGRGSRAASGVYFVRLQADGLIDTKRVTLIK